MYKEADFIHWNDIKGRLKQKYPLLTNADLLWRHGSKEELLKMIAFKLGKTKKELEEIIEEA